MGITYTTTKRREDMQVQPRLIFDTQLKYGPCSIYRVSDERGTLEMSVVNEMPLKKEHLDPNVRAK